MWVFDRATYAFLAVNEAALAKYGYTREEFLRMKILDIRPLADAQRVVDSMQGRDNSLRQAGAWRHVTKSGAVLDVEIESHGLEFDGRPAVLVHARDITSRKRAEDRLRDCLAIGSDWLWETDEEHRFTAVTAPSGSMADINANAFIGKRRWDAPGTQPVSGLWDAHRADLDARREFRGLEYSVANANGITRYVLVSGRPVFAADGRFAGYRGTATDVTVRRQLEAAYQQMFERNPNPMWIYDHKTLEFLAVNDAAVARYGFSREEFLRMRLTDIRPREDEALLRQAVAEMPPTWTSVGLWRHLTKSGELRYVELDTNRTEFAGRSATSVLVRDVTERREAEAKLAETEAHLRQAQKLESVGQLTGGVAHDFNNLLTVILGNLELIQENPAAPAAFDRPLAAVQRAAERGADLTRHLLAFARRQPLDPRLTDVNAMAASLQNLILRTIGENVDVRIVPGDALWSAIVDPGQLETSLLNLVINARDAMPQGGKLTIETANVALDAHYAEMNPEVVPGDYVLVSVSDTGTGMAPEVAAKAFDPFFTTKGHGKGSGLGLSMVYGFVKQSGGHIKLYSEPGHGTSVKLYLPRGAAGAVAAAEPEAVPAQAGGETVLVVEDDDMVRGIAVDHLAVLGYRTVEARNAVEALERLRSGARVDLLFTDVVMPGGMNGRELAQRARALRPGLKVLFTSGYTENAIVHHGRLDPGVLLLQKPYRRQALAQKLRDALGG
jgi:PAS domain S-box-containing protein